MDSSHAHLREALSRPSRLLTRPGLRPAAVALVLDAQDTLLLIRRTTRQGDPWSGHLALPGGHLEPGEDDVTAAIRETHEEVGLALRSTQVLGHLDDRGTPGIEPSRRVRPVVFRIESFPSNFDLQIDEVAGVHLVPLLHLLEGRSRSTFRFRHGENTFQLPCVDVEGFRLWGLTLAVLDDLLDRLDGRGTGLGRTLS